MINSSGICFKEVLWSWICYKKVLHQCGNKLYVVSFYIDRVSSDEFWFSFLTDDNFEDYQIISEDEFLDALKPYKEQIIKVFNDLGI